MSEEINGLFLEYSPDDAAWYWQKPEDAWPTSQMFATRDEALDARGGDELVWSE